MSGRAGRVVFLVTSCLVGVLLLVAAQESSGGTAGPSDEYALVGPRNYWTGYPPTTEDGRLNVVVEIPAGTTAKWEVDKTDGVLRWELKNGKPRIVKYLAYPGNYGMVPGTLLPKELGGDGDPLDVLLLGPAVARGAVVPARLIGVLHMLDGGEQDDKLLAVSDESAFLEVHDTPELEQAFPGVVEILRTWFGHYKGPGVIEVTGLGGVAQAQRVLEASIRAYAER